MTDTDRLIESYLDGELDRHDEAELHRRLAEDASLAEDLRQYAALNAHLDAMAQAELEGVDYDAQRAGIIAALERKVLMEGPPRRRRLPVPAFPVRRMLAAAAALLIVASAAVVLFRTGERPADAPRVDVRVLSMVPGDLGQAEFSVEVVRPVAAPADGAVSADLGMPSGTVMVSIGRGRELTAAGELMEFFDIN